jgi:hypothetical protein
MRPGELLAYLFFLPTIVVGPIHRSPEFVGDHRNLRWSVEHISEGIERIVGGYFKIAVLGNFLVTGKLGALVQSLGPAAHVPDPVPAHVRAALNLYFQFSGFSDVAIGFSGFWLGTPRHGELSLAIPQPQYRRLLATLAHVADQLEPRLRLHADAWRNSPTQARLTGGLY